MASNSMTPEPETLITLAAAIASLPHDCRKAFLRLASEGIRPERLLELARSGNPAASNPFGCYNNLRIALGMGRPAGERGGNFTPVAAAGLALVSEMQTRVRRDTGPAAEHEPRDDQRPPGPPTPAGGGGSGPAARPGPAANRDLFRPASLEGRRAAELAAGFDRHRLTYTERRVHEWIGKCTFNYGRDTVRIETTRLAALYGLHTSTIRRAVVGLVSIGALVVDERRPGRELIVSLGWHTLEELRAVGARLLEARPYRPTRGKRQSARPMRDPCATYPRNDGTQTAAQQAVDSRADSYLKDLILSENTKAETPLPPTAPPVSALSASATPTAIPEKTPEPVMGRESIAASVAAPAPSPSAASGTEPEHPAGWVPIRLHADGRPAEWGKAPDPAPMIDEHDDEPEADHRGQRLSLKRLAPEARERWGPRLRSLAGRLIARGVHLGQLHDQLWTWADELGAWFLDAWEQAASDSEINCPGAWLRSAIPARASAREVSR